MMQFETVRITKEHMDYFARLDPFGFLPPKPIPQMAVLGAVRKGTARRGSKDHARTSEEGGGATDRSGSVSRDIPAGLLVCRRTESAFLVEWVYVAVRYRYRGVGSSMLRLVFDEAKKAGLKEVYGLSINDKDWGKVCPGAEDFFADFRMEPVPVKRANRELYENIVPQERYGAELYQADVDAFFSEIAKKAVSEIARDGIMIL